MTNPYVATRKGRAFDLVRPRAADVDFDEIAYALAGIRRFNRHTLRDYTVAEHCCRVADAMPARFAIHGLLHDAHEAYIGDLTSPFKLALVAIAGQNGGTVAWTLREAARRADEAIYLAAGLPFPLSTEASAAVATADLTLLATEKRDLMAPCERPWLEHVAPLPDFIVPWQSERAEREWMRRFVKFTGASRSRAEAAA